MKVQFVNPHNDSNMYAAPKFFRYASKVSNSLNFNATGALFPPLNLATLAALTPAEHEVAIDDGCLRPSTCQSVGGFGSDHGNDSPGTSGLLFSRSVPCPRHSRWC